MPAHLASDSDPVRFPARGPALSAADGAVLMVVAVVATAWLSASSGRFSPGALLALAVSLAAWWVAGTVLAGTRPLRGLIAWSLPATLLLGFAAVNTALLLLVWVTPTPILWNFALVAAVTGAAAWLRRPALERGGWASAPGMVAVLVALVGATLWARDTLQPIELQGPVAVVKPWIDGYFHAIQIRIFGDARGAATLEDVRLAGVPARLYHYGSYLTPALIRTAGGLSGYETFAGLYVPLGLVLTGLGAAALVGAWWGGWAGVGAAAALLLLPDGFQQGGGNPFLGYHWMQQVGPAGAYGVALLALAWALLLAACRQARPGALLAAWLLGGLVIAYKAQFFVAGALLLWALPPLLFAGIGRRLRVAWLTSALALFAGCLLAARRVPSLPGIWLDGSSTTELLGSVMRWSEAGPVIGVFGRGVSQARGWAETASWGGAYLLVAVLGFWPVAWAALGVALRREVDRFTLLLPALFVANFLVMALGLAMDRSGIGTPEELLHRPFVWMYFVMAAWTGGAAAKLLLRPGPRLAARRGIGAVALGLLLFAPLAADRRVQAIDKMGIAYMRLPAGIVEVSRWLRARAAAGAVIQESGYDPIFVEAGLSDLRPYVNGSIMPSINAAQETQRRVEAVLELRKARDRDVLLAMAGSLGIHWFVLRPGDEVWWPSEVVDRPAFQAGGYRVYRLR